MEGLNGLLDAVDGFVWGWTTIGLLVGTGLFLTARLLFVQIRHLGHAIACVFGKYDQPEESGDISHFKALATALSATIGTGNIAGVATAIALGGPGAVFWMWITALVGMATKFTSCTLAVKYRKIHDDGSASGGPISCAVNSSGAGDAEPKAKVIVSRGSSAHEALNITAVDNEVISVRRTSVDEPS